MYRWLAVLRFVLVVNAVGLNIYRDGSRRACSTGPSTASRRRLEGWFRDELAGVYRDVVLAPDARLRDHLDQQVAAGMLAEHLGGRADLSRRMWLLLAFELWARRWLEVGVRA